MISNMYDVKISVIIPCYNMQDYIGLSIQSIIDQTFTDFELLIVNDGSTDQTEGIVKTFTDPRIKYIKLPYNIGNYGARNTGLRASKGKYVAMLDADDIAKPNRLEIQFMFLEKNKHIGCTGSLSEIINKAGKIIGKINRPLSYKEIKVWSFKDNYLTQSSLMMRSNLLRKHQLLYNEDYRYASDYDFVLKMINFFPVCNLNETLIQYRIHGSQISTQHHSVQKSFANQIRLEALKYLEICPESNDLSIHLKLMNGKLLPENEFDAAILWCNRLLEANEKKNVCHQTSFFYFLKQLLKSSMRLS